jgi:hypothetical protein
MDVVFNEHIHDTPREGSVQSDMDEAVKQLLSDLMINSHIHQSANLVHHPFH